MCQFKSFIVTRDGNILYKYSSDSHEDIIDKYKNQYDLTDNTTEPNKLKFARIEIIPPDDDVFEKDLNQWGFRIDQSIVPTWWKKQLQNKCYDALDKYLKNVLIENQDVDLIENKNGLWIKNSKINILRNSRVNGMWGSSRVNEMWGSSRVNEMRESSRVNEMWGSSQVNGMWGSSRVNEMCGSSRVNEMRESSRVNEMRESSRVNVYSLDSRYNLSDNSIAIIKIGNDPIIKVANKNIEIKYQEKN
jgi:hypothetical protein